MEPSVVVPLVFSSPAPGPGFERAGAQVVRVGGRVVAWITETVLSVERQGQSVDVVLLEPHCVIREGVAVSLADLLARRMAAWRGEGVEWVAIRTGSMELSRWARVMAPIPFFGSSDAQLAMQQHIRQCLHEQMLDLRADLIVARLSWGAVVRSYFTAGDVPSLVSGPSSSVTAHSRTAQKHVTQPVQTVLVAHHPASMQGTVEVPVD